MSSKKLIPLFLLPVFAACGGDPEKKKVEGTLTYPSTRKVDSVDTYFNNKIEDPYRWLENDRSEETAEWVKKENQITFDYLDKIPFRNKIKERLTAIWNYEKRGVPFKKGKNYFFYKNDGIQNQSVLYVQEGLSGTPRVLLDPNTLASDGTASLGDLTISKNGKHLAYTINRAGSDWSTIYVLEIETGKKLADELKWIKFSNIAWKDNGFYYGAYDAPKAGTSELSDKNEFHKIFYHVVGDTQEKDQLVYEDKQHPQRSFTPVTTDDEELLLIYITESTSGSALSAKDLTKKNAPFVSLVDNFEHEYTLIDHVGTSLYLLTNKEAPKYQLVEIDQNKKTPYESWKKIIPETGDLLESVSLCKDKFIVDYLKDVTTRLYIYDRNGKQERELKLPGLCKVNSLTSYKDDALVFFSYSTFTAPSIVYKYDLTSDKLDTWFTPSVDFKSEEYETKQVFYPSKDGTKVPMFITCKKGLQLDGNNPCYLYGYGGFNAIYTPAFRPDCAIFLENGGIYAIPGVRGGGDYGEDWHKAGIKCKKQNVFDDFIAAAEYLIKEKYTSSAKLAINGRSNGGLLIGAVMTQRPDLAKVAIPTVGVLDMLRYHKFTIGWAWASDYGTSADEEEYKCLIKYSPLHNVKEVEYPATLVTTGDHDDRVVPAHSFKFISTLQEKQKGSNPVLIRIDTNAGHGSGKPTSKQIDEFSDIWSFVFYNLGMTY